MNSPISAIHKFKKIINYTTEGPEIALFVYAEVMKKVVYQSNAMCSISQDDKNGGYCIGIEWKNLDDEEVAHRGLHRSYSTNYQKMQFKGESLIIVTDSGMITLSKA